MRSIAKTQGGLLRAHEETRAILQVRITFGVVFVVYHRAGCRHEFGITNSIFQLDSASLRKFV